MGQGRDLGCCGWHGAHVHRGPATGSHLTRGTRCVWTPPEESGLYEDALARAFLCGFDNEVHLVIGKVGNSL